MNYCDNQTAHFSVFNNDTYFLARTPTCKKIVPPPLLQMWGYKKNFFACFARESRFVPPLLKPWRRPCLTRSHGKRPDGLSLVPWEAGKPLTWDVKVICQLADLYVAAAAREAGSFNSRRGSH